MCLAVPMKIVKLSGQNAVVEIGGVLGSTNLQLVENVRIGDYVIVHAGFAIEKVNEEEALKTIGMLREMERIATSNDRYLGKSP
jgi:hydrogenase expression/formation protein HypC